MLAQLYKSTPKEVVGRNRDVLHHMLLASCLSLSPEVVNLAASSKAQSKVSAVKE